MIRYTAQSPQRSLDRPKIAERVLVGARHVWPTGPGKSPRSAIADMIDSVSKATGITAFDILSDRRMRPIAHARQAAMWLVRHCTHLSMPQIARHFHKDHTTVLHAVFKVDQRMATKPGFAQMMNELRARHQAGSGSSTIPCPIP